MRHTSSVTCHETEKVQQRQLGSQPLYALVSPSTCTADRTAAGLPVRLDRCWRASRVETMANVGVDGGRSEGSVPEIWSMALPRVWRRRR